MENETQKGSRGRVSLVGAGPGDPRWLTLRGRELLDTADVVAYDELIAPELLATVPEGAELVAVGRRSTDRHPVAYGLHPLVLVHAREGKHVVRLKAGDPFIFGRGGEEAEILGREGIPFEIVPGISAGLGAAVRAFVPLTHRDHASDVVFASGHDLVGGRETKTDWARVGSGSGTVVLYMASRRLEANLGRLLREGRSPETPALYIAAASTPDEVVVEGTLGTLAEKASWVDRKLPGLVLVGDVVGLRARLPRDHQGPLWGKRILLARARPGESQIARQLEQWGATVWQAPTVRVEPPRSYETLDAALRDLSVYRAVVVGCAESVEGALARLRACGIDVRSLPLVPFVATGEAAGAALEAVGIVPRRPGRGFLADSLSGFLGRLPSDLGPNAPVLLWGPEGEGSRLAMELEASGVPFVPCGTHRFAPSWSRVEVPPVEAVVYPSAGAARAVLAGPTRGVALGAKGIAMDPESARAAREGGARVDAVAAEARAESLVLAVAQVLLGEGAERGHGSLDVRLGDT